MIATQDGGQLMSTCTGSLGAAMATWRDQGHSALPWLVRCEGLATSARALRVGVQEHELSSAQHSQPVSSRWGGRRQQRCALSTERAHLRTGRVHKAARDPPGPQLDAHTTNPTVGAGAVSRCCEGRALACALLQAVADLPASPGVQRAHEPSHMSLATETDKHAAARPRRYSRQSRHAGQAQLVAQARGRRSLQRRPRYAPLW